jgi:Protein of unknown function (DUF1573)
LQKIRTVKKIILVLLVCSAIVSCDMRRKDKIADDAEAQRILALKDSTTVQIIDTAYDFKTAAEGEKVIYNYRFKNTGTKPLVIVKATPSCGCTVPEIPEKPILPGETGFIKVAFDSKTVGPAHKTITVISNAKPEFPPLILTGNVVAKEKSGLTH